jgi:predicted transposase YdaD
MGANREYKDTVFTKLFSRADTLLELYNALSGSEYGADTAIEINTLEDTLFMDMMNDISFTIADKIVILIEHQATLNQNLPLRFLLYVARVYEKTIDQKAVYRQKMMKIPSPELIVLYNGKSAFPDEKLLRLSDAFHDIPEHSEKYGSLELTVRVLNINAGYNEGILSRSATLHGYVTFVRKVREGVDGGKELSIAVTDAVSYCAKNQILQPFLKNHASEVMNMLTTEFKLEDAIQVWKEEGYEEGVEKGIRIMIEKMRANGLSDEKIADLTGLTVEGIRTSKDAGADKSTEGSP